jgi:phage FluMu gp28-like protein
MALAALSPEELDEFEELSRAKLDDQYAADPWRWLCEQVVTVDESSQLHGEWPAHKDYVHDLVDVFESDERKIAIPKSRRMLVTWTFAALCTHRARFKRANSIIWQSQNEEKAAVVVDKRCAFIEDHLKDPLTRRDYHPIRTSDGLIGKMTYKRTGSYIWAVPQGGDVFRSYTASIVVMDEVDFMDKGHDALTAAIPLAEKAAKLILITTSNGPRGVVAGVCKDAGFVRYR